MSTIHYARDGLTITTYAGPVDHNSPNTNSRTMVQIATYHGFVTLTMDHWVDLVSFIGRLAREGIGILGATELTRDDKPVWLVEDTEHGDEYGPPALLAVCTSAERAEELRAGAFGGRASGITSRRVIADEYLAE